LCLASLFLVLAGRANACEPLRVEINKLARAILSTIGDKHTVKVGIFALKTTGLEGINSGPGIERLLIQELEALRKGAVRDSASFEVNGDFVMVQASRDAQVKVIRIKARVCDPMTGDEVNTLAVPPVTLSDNKSITEVLQVTTSLPSEDNFEVRNRKIEQAARKPTVFLQDPGQSRATVNTSCPFSMEIRARKDVNGKFESRKLTVEKGQAFVQLERGDLYEVVVHNRSGKEIAVTLKIDGIDQFHFMKERINGRPALSHWILGNDPKSGKPREMLRVPGWFNTMVQGAQDTYQSFKVVSYGEGALGKTGMKCRGNVGVIRVGIFEAYPLLEGQAHKSGDETGFGPPVAGNVKPVRYGVGPEVTSIAIRYTREQK